MRSSTLSIKVFGMYVILTGVGLAVAPTILLSLFGFSAPTEIWVRVLGALAIVVGYYYWACGIADARAFFKASIIGRILFCALCVLLVVFAGAPVPLIIFGVVDVLGAAWTWFALRREQGA